MMQITDNLKDRLDVWLQPRVAKAANMNITPSHLLIAGLLLSMVGAVVVTAGSHLSWPLLIVPFILLGRYVLSSMAIILMCEHRLNSPFYIFLVELSDIAAAAFLFLPFALIPGLSPLLVTVAVIMGILCEVASIVGVPICHMRRNDGPIDSTDRFLVFGGLALILGVGIPGDFWVNLVMIALIILEAITLSNRIRASLTNS